MWPLHIHFNENRSKRQYTTEYGYNCRLHKPTTDNHSHKQQDMLGNFHGNSTRWLQEEGEYTEYDLWTEKVHLINI